MHVTALVLAGGAYTIAFVVLALLLIACGLRHQARWDAQVAARLRRVVRA